MLAEMEDGGREHRACMAFTHTGHEVVEPADAAGCDHRHRHGVRNVAHQREVVARARPIAVHGGDEKLAGPERGDLAGELDGVEPGGAATAMGEDLPAPVGYL